MSARARPRRRLCSFFFPPPPDIRVVSREFSSLRFSRNDPLARAPAFARALNLISIAHFANDIRSTRSGPVYRREQQVRHRYEVGRGIRELLSPPFRIFHYVATGRGCVVRVFVYASGLSVLCIARTLRLRGSTTRCSSIAIAAAVTYAQRRRPRWFVCLVCDDYYNPAVVKCLRVCKCQCILRGSNPPS